MSNLTNSRLNLMLDKVSCRASVELDEGNEGGCRIQRLARFTGSGVVYRCDEESMRRKRRDVPCAAEVGSGEQVVSKHERATAGATQGNLRGWLWPLAGGEAEYATRIRKSLCIN
ncbi:hypothetical protein M758_3G125500 [Ceratodon purpureus]|uniref:Uncharacterized protein n=1 Tax=Ceratodon purpureus TaxID=3225 RepID=A0A8T0IL60_CERPU|nr:hypothetical protein KC19_3G124000 [Ceratodon purpureus]KAG0622811.1 hypothetical protein M758_3G125500 [Ceratodon purpureus]